MMDVTVEQTSEVSQISQISQVSQSSKIPHIAIIMDGNNRYAQANNIDIDAAHAIGAKAAKNIILAAEEIGLKELTLYGFSSENWHRDESEVNNIIKLMNDYLISSLDELHAKGVKINIIGDVSKFDDITRANISKVMEKTRLNKNFLLNIAMSYGGREEIIFATKKICNMLLDAKISMHDINETLFKDSLYAYDMSYPDLLIRTGGDSRVSNFLLWQIAYTEIYFSKSFWPDFTKSELIEIMECYCQRERRYGVR